MNRSQKIALAVAVANLIVLLLFPPFDPYSIANSIWLIFKERRSAQLTPGQIRRRSAHWSGKHGR